MTDRAFFRALGSCSYADASAIRGWYAPCAGPPNESVDIVAFVYGFVAHALKARAWNMRERTGVRPVCPGLAECLFAFASLL